MLRTIPQAGGDSTIQVPVDKLQALDQAVNTVRDAAYALATAASMSLDHIHGAVTPRTLDLQTALQLAANSRVDVSEDGDARAKAEAEGADPSMLPFHLKSVVKAVGELVSDFANKLAAGDFDAKVEAQEAHGYVQCHGCPSAEKTGKRQRNRPSCGSLPVTLLLDQPSHSHAPWVQRAEAMRRAVSQTLDLPKQLDERVAEVKELKNILKVSQHLGSAERSFVAQTYALSVTNSPFLSPLQHPHPDS